VCHVPYGSPDLGTHLENGHCLELRCLEGELASGVVIVDLSDPVGLPALLLLQKRVSTLTAPSVERILRRKVKVRGCE
jgi:hypothetical protein